MERYQEHISFLDEEVDNLRDIMQNWADQVDSLNGQLKEVKIINERQRNQHQRETKEINDKYQTEIKELRSSLERTQKSLSEF